MLQQQLLFLENRLTRTLKNDPNKEEKRDEIAYACNSMWQR